MHELPDLFERLVLGQKVLLQYIFIIIPVVFHDFLVSMQEGT
jgi:hypothetical protein